MTPQRSTRAQRFNALVHTASEKQLYENKILLKNSNGKTEFIKLRSVLLQMVSFQESCLLVK